MKNLSLLTCLSALAAMCYFVSGCASADVNPQVPHAKTGYVDIYCAENAGIDWDVKRFSAPDKRYLSVFSELNPVDGGVLRLAFPPGPHKLRITVLNHVIKTPADIDAEVVDGKITPLRIAFNDVGDVVVQSSQTSIGASAAGRYRRPVTLTSTEADMYDLSAIPSEPIAYLPKQRMSYWRQAPNSK
jgi:hypothetical protein